ncbi:MAG TPA: hypothetical protein VH437_03245 [Terriglobales bacterium]|jgi:hypothetical protein
MRIPELKQGQGRLVARGTDSQEYAVQYRLNILTSTVEQSGAEPIISSIRSRGSVRALDGRALPIGHYDLHTDKEIIHIENTGMSWVVLK